ncbi:MAG: hypothetical protein R3Y23_02225 [Bacillota bacterium]
MDYKIMLPHQVWEGYNVTDSELSFHEGDTTFDGAITTKNCYFTALGDGLDAVTVALKLFIPQEANGSTIVVVPEYSKPADANFVKKIAELGFVVIVPDISGVAMPATMFGESYSYGCYHEAGEHLTKVCPTAKDTCQYLYSVIVKRTIYVADCIFGYKKPILLGLGSGVEVAMQVAGSTENTISAIAAINGSGYGEYIKHHKYGGGQELVMDSERMSWLAGVASVAYAKYIEVPMLISIGSNSTKADIDRLSNLIALLPHNNVVLTTSAGTDDYILKPAADSVKAWLNMIAKGESMPTMPETNISVSKDGKTYAYVKFDNGYNIDNTTIYYSSGEYNHAVRDWFHTKVVTVSQNEVLGQVTITDEEAPLFVYADVCYSNGLICSTVVDFLDLSGQEVIQENRIITNIVFEPSFGVQCFVSECSGVARLENSLGLVELESGVTGITAGEWGIKTYNIGTHSAQFADNILRIDFATDVETDVILTVQRVVKGDIVSFSYTVNIPETNGYFKSVMLTASSFKDERYMSLEDWRDVKSLAISGGVIVGSIIFI